MSLINPNKKYKKLVTSGCSFTQGHYQGEEAAWGYQLSQLLGCEHVNRGSGGSSNNFILHKIIKYCESNDMTDCCVGIQLSERSRREYWLKDKGRYTTINGAAISDEFYQLGGLEESHAEFLNKNQEFFHEIWFDDSENALRTIQTIILAKSYLLSKNIDFIIFEGIGNLLDTEHKIVSSYNGDIDEGPLVRNDYKTKLLDDDHIYKKYPNMMPFMFNHELFNDDNGRHPNIEFVKWWVNEMYDYLKEKNNV